MGRQSCCSSMADIPARFPTLPGTPWMTGCLPLSRRTTSCRYASSRPSFPPLSVSLSLSLSLLTSKVSDFAWIFLANVVLASVAEDTTLQACWQAYASAHTSITRPFGSLTFYPSLLPLYIGKLSGFCRKSLRDRALTSIIKKVHLGGMPAISCAFGSSHPLSFYRDVHASQRTVAAMLPSLYPHVSPDARGWLSCSHVILPITAKLKDVVSRVSLVPRS